MLYRIVTKTYSRKSDVLVLRRIAEGQFAYRVEKTGKKWTFTAIVPEPHYEAFSRCL